MMKITLSAIRSLENNKIVEKFTWQPQHHYYKDTKRQLYHIMRTYINKLAIHQYDYKLIDIQYYDDKILYIYDYNSPPKQLIESISFDYLPVLGEKKCKKCRNYKRYNGKAYCLTKGIKLKKKSHYRCLYWSENVMNNKEEESVYKCRRSKKHDSSNR